MDRKEVTKISVQHYDTCFCVLPVLGMQKYYGEMKRRTMSTPLHKLAADLERWIRTSAHPLAVILGHTASGKTGLSIALALELKQRGIETEIINADSRQCYRHLDIGTAKIRAEEMRGIEHHLLNALDPKEKLTAAWYQEHAMRLIYEIQGRGALPLLVGGSMLYISSVIDGLKLCLRPIRSFAGGWHRSTRRMEDSFFLLCSVRSTRRRLRESIRTISRT